MRKEIQEVERLNHNQLDVGHVLLAMIGDREGECANILHSMGVNLDDLVAEIERRLSQTTFPLRQALTAFADQPRVQQLREQIDYAQQQIESHVQQADFETAASHRDQKADVTRQLESLLEQLWQDSKR